MQETRRRRSKRINSLDDNHSRKSINSDNLHVSLSPSTFRKVRPTSSRASTAKLKTRQPESRKSVQNREQLVRLSRAPPSEVPENVAVHFASFYQNHQELRQLPHSGDEKLTGSAKTARNLPKMEFTRQMVHKLEHSAGTQHYGRQVSALLDETVESPGFDLKLPPVDNCAPFNKSNDYYPLWYKDPNKMPQISRQQFRELKNKYNEMATRAYEDDVKRLEESCNASSATETETESEESESCSYNDFRFGWSPAKTRSDQSRKSSRSSRSGITLESIKSSIKKHRSIEKSVHPRTSSEASRPSSSSTSCATETDDRVSSGWETTDTENEDDKVQVKIAANFQKTNCRRLLTG